MNIPVPKGTNVELKIRLGYMVTSKMWNILVMLHWSN